MKKIVTSIAIVVAGALLVVLLLRPFDIEVAFGATSYQSSQSATGSGAGCTVTAPASIAVGDLLVASIGNDDAANTSIGSPGGSWTQIEQTTFGTSPGGGNLTSFYKVADSGDAAAGTFAFTFGSGPYACAVSRFNGTATVAPITDTPTEANGSGTTVNPAAHTFSTDKELLYMAGASSVAETWNINVTGSTQTVTERVDVSTTASTDYSLSVATDIPNAGTTPSSGTINITRNTGGETAAGHAFIIKAAVSPTVPPSSDVIVAD